MKRVEAVMNFLTRDWEVEVFSYESGKREEQLAVGKKRQ